MHNRGKAMEIKVFYPDGRSEELLNVPRYDFSWQTSYSFKQPVAIPKGTRFVVTGYFDNSAKNRYNPDPAKAVRFGDPTYDEMMVGWILITRWMASRSNRPPRQAIKARKSMNNNRGQSTQSGRWWTRKLYGRKCGPLKRSARAGRLLSIFRTADYGEII